MEEKLHFYVYILIDPRTNKPFYVGKGVRDRCFAHLEEARNTTKDSAGDYPKLKTIRDIEKHGQVQIDLLRWGLEGPEGERTAFAIEAAAIDLYRLELDNRASGLARGRGRITAEEADLELGAVPAVFDPRHKVMLIRVARQFQVGMGSDELYTATRQWWRIGKDRLKLGTPRSPDYAMAVFRGVVRAVYRIEQWSAASPKLVNVDPSVNGRWAFSGQLDPNLDAMYFGSDVSALLPSSAQNPIRYVNCDG